MRARSRQAEAAQALITNVENFVRNLAPDAVVVMHAASPPAFRKGERAQDLVDRSRKDLGRLSAELHRVRSAPYPARVVKIAVREQVRALAERGQPNVHDAIETGAAVRWPMFWDTTPDGKSWNIVPDLAGFMAWFDADRLLQKLDAEIDAQSDDAAALDPEERRDLERQLLGQILDTERLEEQAIEAAKAEGYEMGRRPAASPLAVLGIEVLQADTGEVAP